MLWDSGLELTSATKIQVSSKEDENLTHLGIIRFGNSQLSQSINVTCPRIEGRFLDEHNSTMTPLKRRSMWQLLPKLTLGYVVRFAGDEEKRNTISWRLEIWPSRLGFVSINGPTVLPISRWLSSVTLRSFGYSCGSVKANWTMIRH